MTKYNIPLRVKLSNKEYDKIKDVKNKSAYVRKAINFYNWKQPLEIELTKKNLLNEIKNEVEKEHERFYKELLNNEELKEERIMNTLNKMSDKCDEELLKIDKEKSKYENTAFETFDTQTTEEKILSILPTLQGIYHSEIGLDYESLRRQATNIGINPKELKDWVDNHPELINETDYLYRTRNRKTTNSKKHTFEYD